MVLELQAWIIRSDKSNFRPDITPDLCNDGVSVAADQRDAVLAACDRHGCGKKGGQSPLGAQNGGNPTQKMQGRF